ncbi:MAG: OmpA family protein [Bacteroidales bacterium]
MKHICFLITFFIYVLFNLSQAYCQENIEDMNAREMKRYGLQAMNAGDIYTAVDYLSVYAEEKPEDAKILYTLGELYFRARNYPKAETYYQKAFREKRYKYPSAQFKKAVCLKMQGKYEEALREFEVFKRYQNEVDDTRYYNYRLETEIEGCKMALKDSIKSNYVVTNMHEINHNHIDFNPIPRGENRLIYASLPLDELRYFDPMKDTIPKRCFFQAVKQRQTWKTIGEFGDDIINSSEYDTGNGAFSLDGNSFYFTRCNKGTDNNMICHIYKTEKKNNIWQEPQRLNDEINTPYATSTMPAVGVSRLNTDMLYFVSDREGGQGGMDIWYTYWDPRRDAYTSPRNCGRRINTIADEITPYYHVDSRTLFFSSNGYPNYGGYDVFRSRGNGHNFSDPENLGKPINSEVDDLYFSKAVEGYFGYFVSNRPAGKSIRHSTCCDDIYRYIDSDYIRIWLTGQIYSITDLSFYNSIREEYEQNLTLDHVKYDSKDSASMKLLDKYPVSLFMKDPDTGEESFIITDSTNQGRYWFNLEQGIDYVLKVKDFNRDEKFFSLSTKNITHDDTIHMDAIIINTFPTEPLILKHVYYEYNDFQLSEQAKKIIDSTIYKLLEKHPKIIIEISSHTDSVGSDEYNLTLSQKRAESVVRHLIEKGIPKDRLRAKGYGESKPIAPNTNPDGSDNPEGRAKNRRTEFRIIGELEEYSDIIYEE